MRLLILFVSICIGLFIAEQSHAQDQMCTASDPYGLEAYDSSGVIAPCLEACAADTNCPKNLDARFWLLVDEVVSLETEVGQCFWTNEKGQPIRHNFIANENFELNGGEDFIALPIATGFVPFKRQGHGSTGGQSVSHSGGTHFEERILTVSFKVRGRHKDCERYADIARTKEIFSGLEALALQGSKMATNEVGYFYLTEPGFFDAQKAQAYLENCARDGDPDCLFNLARLHTIIDPDGCGPCLILLRQANRQGSDPGIKVALQLAEVLFAGRETLILVKDEWSLWARLNEVVNLFPNWHDRLDGLTLHAYAATARPPHSRR